MTNESEFRRNPIASLTKMDKTRKFSLQKLLFEEIDEDDTEEDLFNGQGISIGG